jgi:hypothetical protein
MIDRERRWFGLTPCHRSTTVLIRIIYDSVERTFTGLNGHRGTEGEQR